MLKSASSTPRERTALIGLGGNQGDVRAAFVAALAALEAHRDCEVEAVSGLYSTPPWGKTDQNRFLNACARLKTRLVPLALLDFLQELEIRAGRVRTEKWGPRPLDLDILAVGRLSVASDRLTLPHPYVHERGFVLRPLADIAPRKMFNARTVNDWLGQADTKGIEPTGPSITLSEIRSEAAKR